MRAGAQARVSDLTLHSGDVPVRLVGYGLVVGLDGTGDRSFGTSSGAVQTVRSVTNLLRRFNIEVPDDRLRLRNVAAVLVTAEMSPYLRPGGRFDVQVASVGDATSLRGGVLWVTPLTLAPDAPPIASAQGPLPLAPEARLHYFDREGTSARVTGGGVLEMSLPAVPAVAPALLMRAPDLDAAARVAAAINAARGAGTATVQDAGSIALKAPAADSLASFLAGIDTLSVTLATAPRIVIDARSGIVVAGGDMQVHDAVVSIKGITVRIGDSTAAAPAAAAPPPPAGLQAVPPTAGVVAVKRGASVREIATGLQALGAEPAEVAAVFDGLHAAGAITADVVIR